MLPDAGAILDQRTSTLADDVRDGLCRIGQKELPSKYLYDDVGSSLFDVICLLPEYGLTRADAQLLSAHADEIVARMPRPTLVAELDTLENIPSLTAMLR